jgi:hypothetical protein
MKGSSKHIQNLDQLEKEIYRLKFQSKQLEDKLDNHFDYLQHNYGTLMIHSLFGHKEEPHQEGTSFAQTLVQNSRMKAAMDKIVSTWQIGWRRALIGTEKVAKITCSGKIYPGLTICRPSDL